jgi:hypothetical protein
VSTGPTDPSSATLTDLRPEATPLPYHRLSEMQQAAYRRLASMLARAVGDAERAGQAPPGERAAGFGFGSDLETERKARVALISGDRGTGKTSVVLSVIRDVRNRSGPDFAKAAAPGSKDPAQEALKADVERLFNRVVWLDMLDMAPLPASANLFSAILVRVEEAATRRMPRELAEEKPRGFLDAPEVYDAPLEKLRRLQTDVAVAWEGNLKERSGALDANVFAAEVRRTEFLRLKFNSRLAEVLDGLAVGFGRREGNDPATLFVLPVDDFDLNPPRCLELLEMLRVLSVPRLFFIVLGDVDVAETMCGLQMAADVAKVAGRAPAADFLPYHRDDVQATVADVAGNTIRKLLPPSQRVYLEAMKVDQAVEFCPPGRPGAGSKSIAGWLREIPFDLPDCHQAIKRRYRLSSDGTAGPTLYDFLFAELPPVSGEPVRSRGFYSGRRFLEVPLRQLVDLWLRLEQMLMAPDGTRPALVKFRRLLHTYCREVIRAEETLPAESRRNLSAAFGTDPDSGWWSISLEPFQISPVLVTNSLEVTPQPPPPATYDQLLRWTVRARGASGWEFRKDLADKSSGPVLLAPDVTSLLITYTDLVTLTLGFGEPNPLLSAWRVAYLFASTLYVHPALKSFLLSWAFPPFLTVWEADKFLDGWSRVVRSLEGMARQATSPRDLIPTLVYHWIWLGRAVLSGAPAAVVPSDLPEVTAERWDTLKTLVEGIYIASIAPSPIQSSLRRWLVEVLSLLNRDVLGPDEAPRNAFRESVMLRGLCRKEGRHFLEWKAAVLNEGGWEDTGSRDEFWKTVRGEPNWWD